MRALQLRPDPRDQRIEELEAEVRWLRDQLAIEQDAETLARLRRLYRLSQGAGLLLMVLLKRRGRVASRAFLEEWVDRRDDADERASNVLAVYVNRIRQMLGARAIVTVRGIGWALSIDAVLRIEKALEAWP